ncbi:MAG TPA: hypothetical protein VFE78_20205, partial [Gemmataceae bacterium]|nr:hypothetical protein [Gemmataceae bacterium]
MQFAFPGAKRLLTAGLLAALCLRGPAAGHAQEALQRPPAAPDLRGEPAAPPAELPPAGDAGPAAGGGGGGKSAALAPPAAAPGVIDTGSVAETPLSCPEGDQPAAASSIWAKVPPPFQYTKIGGLFVLPSGPGYYSFFDLLTDNYRQSPPVFPVPPFGLIPPVPYFDANYRYLDKPDNDQTNWADFTKRIHLGDNWMLSVGGEERIRYNNEVDSRLTGKDNVFESYRSRVYGDLWYRDLFRVYVEYIDANVSNQDLPPSPSD